MVDEITSADVVNVVIFVFFLEALCSKSSSRVVFVVLGLVRGVLFASILLFTYPEDAPRSDV